MKVRLRFLAEDAKDHVKVGLDCLQLTKRCRAQVAVSSPTVPGRNGGAEMHGWSLWQARRKSNTNESVSKTDSQSTSFRYLREFCVS